MLRPSHTHAQLRPSPVPPPPPKPRTKLSVGRGCHPWPAFSQAWVGPGWDEVHPQCRLSRFGGRIYPGAVRRGRTAPCKHVLRAIRTVSHDCAGAEVLRLPPVAAPTLFALATRTKHTHLDAGHLRLPVPLLLRQLLLHLLHFLDLGHQRVVQHHMFGVALRADRRLVDGLKGTHAPRPLPDAPHNAQPRTNSGRVRAASTQRDGSGRPIEGTETSVAEASTHQLPIPPNAVGGRRSRDVVAALRRGKWVVVESIALWEGSEATSTNHELRGEGRLVGSHGRCDPWPGFFLPKGGGGGRGVIWDTYPPRIFKTAPSPAPQRTRRHRR